MFLFVFVVNTPAAYPKRKSSNARRVWLAIVPHLFSLNCWTTSSYLLVFFNQTFHITTPITADKNKIFFLDSSKSRHFSNSFPSPPPPLALLRQCDDIFPSNLIDRRQCRSIKYLNQIKSNSCFFVVGIGGGMLEFLISNEIKVAGSGRDF